MKSRLPLPSLTLSAVLLSGTLLPAQTTIFHYRVSDTDAAGLPTIPSVGGMDGTAIGADPLNADVPTIGVPAGAGNRSLNGAGLPGGGVNSAGTLELSNAEVVANGGFTFECWFKWFGGGNVNSIIDYAGTEKFRIPGAGGVLDMNFDSGSGPLVLGNVSTGQWYYVAMVFEHDGNPEVGGQINGTATWYLDGTVEAGTAPVTKDDFGDSLNRPIGVGRHPLGFGGDNFDGLVYEPRVSLGALEPAQLLYSSTPAGDPQLIAGTSVSENSDGRPLQLTIPIQNGPGTTLPLNLTAPTVTGPDAGDFVVASFDTPIAADGGMGSIVVDFTPSTGDGQYEAILTINTDDPLNPMQEVSLAVDVRDPAIVIDSALDFSLFNEVPDPIEDFISVENLGGVTDLVLSDPRFTGPGASAYSLVAPPDPVAPGTFATVDIRFAPTTGGDYTAQLEFTTNDPRNPVVVVALTAEVRDPEALFFPDLSFGSFPANPGPQTAIFDVENFGLGTALELSNPTVEGPAGAFYTVTSLPASIPPTGRGQVEVTFDPGTNGGSFPAVLMIETNDPFTPVMNVALGAFVEGPIDLDGPSKVSHFTFDNAGNLGDDTGGLDYDGTPFGDVTASNQAAVGSGAVALGGSEDYIEVPQGGYPYHAMDDDGEGFTIATWVCSSSEDPGGRQRYFSKFFTTGGGAFGVGQNNDTQFIGTTYGVFDYLGGTLFAQDEWHHIAFVYRGSPVDTIDYFVDGTLQATTTGTAGLNEGPGSFAIGGLGGGAGEWFDGLLDDLRVYAVELSDDDIAALAALGTPGEKPVEPDDIEVGSVGLVSPTRLRIEFTGAANTAHVVRSSADLAVSPFTGVVTPAVDGLTTDATGAGFVEIDITVPGALFYQIQEP